MQAVPKRGRIVVSMFLRFLVGAVLWVVLGVLVVASAIPYGGGSAMPLYLFLIATIAVPIWAFLPLNQFSSNGLTTRELQVHEQCGSAVLQSIKVYRTGAQQVTYCPACEGVLTLQSVEQAGQNLEQVFVECQCGKCNGQYEFYKTDA